MTPKSSNFYLDSTNLTQHVSFRIHRDHHILDLLITANSSMRPVTDHSFVSMSDYFRIIFLSFRLCQYHLFPPTLSQFSFHCMKSISVSKFTRDILNSLLITHSPPKLCDLVDAYNTTLSTLLDAQAPIKTKINEINLSTNGLGLSLWNLPADTLKYYGPALVHLTNSNSFAQPRTNPVYHDKD